MSSHRIPPESGAGGGRGSSGSHRRSSSGTRHQRSQSSAAAAAATGGDEKSADHVDLQQLAPSLSSTPLEPQHQHNYQHQQEHQHQQQHQVRYEHMYYESIPEIAVPPPPPPTAFDDSGGDDIQLQRQPQRQPQQQASSRNVASPTAPIPAPIPTHPTSTASDATFVTAAETLSPRQTMPVPRPFQQRQQSVSPSTQPTSSAPAVSPSNSAHTSRANQSPAHPLTNPPAHPLTNPPAQRLTNPPAQRTTRRHSQYESVPTTEFIHELLPPQAPSVEPPPPPPPTAVPTMPTPPPPSAAAAAAAATLSAPEHQYYGVGVITGNHISASPLPASPAFRSGPSRVERDEAVDTSNENSPNSGDIVRANNEADKAQLNAGLARMLFRRISAAYQMVLTSLTPMEYWEFLKSFDIRSKRRHFYRTPRPHHEQGLHYSYGRNAIPKQTGGLQDDTGFYDFLNNIPAYDPQGLSMDPQQYNEEQQQKWNEEHPNVPMPPQTPPNMKVASNSLKAFEVFSGKSMFQPFSRLPIGLSVECIRAHAMGAQDALRFNFQQSFVYTLLENAGTISAVINFVFKFEIVRDFLQFIGLYLGLVCSPSNGDSGGGSDSVGCRFSNYATLSLSVIFALQALVWDQSFWMIPYPYINGDTPEYRPPDLKSFPPGTTLDDLRPLDSFCYTTTMLKDSTNLVPLALLIALVALAFVSFYFPFAMRKIIRRNRPVPSKYDANGIKCEDSDKIFFYGGYHFESSTQRVFIMVSKFVLTFFTVLVSKNNCWMRSFSRHQLDLARQIILFILTIVMLLIHWWTKPFIAQTRNVSELVSRTASMFTALLGILVAVSIGSARVFEIITGVVNTIAGVIILWYTMIELEFVKGWVAGWRKRIMYRGDLFTNVAKSKEMMVTIMRYYIWQDTLTAMIMTYPEFSESEHAIDMSSSFHNQAGGERLSNKQREAFMRLYRRADMALPFNESPNRPPFLLRFGDTVAERHLENLRILNSVGYEKYLKEADKTKLISRALCTSMEEMQRRFTGPDMYYNPELVDVVLRSIDPAKNRDRNRTRRADSGDVIQNISGGRVGSYTSAVSDVSNILTRVNRINYNRVLDDPNRDGGGGNDHEGANPKAIKSHFGKSFVVPFPLTIIHVYDDDIRQMNIIDEPEELLAYAEMNRRVQKTRREAVRLKLRALEDKMITLPRKLQRAASLHASVFTSAHHGWYSKNGAISGKYYRAHGLAKPGIVGRVVQFIYGLSHRLHLGVHHGDDLDNYSQDNEDSEECDNIDLLEPVDDDPEVSMDANGLSLVEGVPSNHIPELSNVSNAAELALFRKGKLIIGRKRPAFYDMNGEDVEGGLVDVSPGFNVYVAFPRKLTPEQLKELDGVDDGDIDNDPVTGAEKRRFLHRIPELKMVRGKHLGINSSYTLTNDLKALFRANESIIDDNLQKVTGDLDAYREWADNVNANKARILSYGFLVDVFNNPVFPVQTDPNMKLIFRSTETLTDEYVNRQRSQQNDVVNDTGAAPQPQQPQKPDPNSDPDYGKPYNYNDFNWLLNRLLLFENDECPIKRVTSTHQHEMHIMWERLRRIRCSWVSTFWYLFWDNVFRYNRHTIYEMRANDSQFNPYYPTSIAYNPCARPQLYNFLLQRKMWNGQGSSGFFHDGLLNQLYDALYWIWVNFDNKVERCPSEPIYADVMEMKRRSEREKLEIMRADSPDPPMSDVASLRSVRTEQAVAAQQNLTAVFANIQTAAAAQHQQGGLGIELDELDELDEEKQQPSSPHVRFATTNIESRPATRQQPSHRNNRTTPSSQYRST
ncbi:hypothetical protein GQ42DRAFT_176834 [Ramicandelaber brevisporus]|nr:hypothetical protein GQ42DRAFT_176834 [Ramicandelaber brevisporus]